MLIEAEGVDIHIGKTNSKLEFMTVINSSLDVRTVALRRVQGMASISPQSSSPPEVKFPCFPIGWYPILYMRTCWYDKCCSVASLSSPKKIKYNSKLCRRQTMSLYKAKTAPHLQRLQHRPKSTHHRFVIRFKTLGLKDHSPGTASLMPFPNSSDSSFT